jgi:hypothetical protein
VNCECGCGQPAPISKYTIRKRGWVKGQPVRFVLGHYKRQISTSLYPEITVKELGRSIRIHQLRAEKALGHRLPPGAQVHHVDGDKHNPNARLVICQNLAYHKLLHYRADVLRAGGNPNTDRLCRMCEQPQPTSEFYRRKSGRGAGEYVSHCKDCDRGMHHAR